MTKAEIRSQNCRTVNVSATTATSMVSSPVVSTATSPAGNPASSNPAAQVGSRLESGAVTPFHPVVNAYFSALNAADYPTIASLFAAEGTLLPPFETAIVGREAILQYLTAEAKSMTALPQSADQKPEANGTNVQVLGQVQTSLFSVNVSWQFSLNAEAEIVQLKIKLLATLKDLLHLKP